MLFVNLADYFVDDLIYDDSEVIFVLESPHTQEVKNGYPVAGKSGIDMSKVLFSLDEPFGKLIFNKKIKKIGIINVSNYPLQNSAYSNPNLKDIEYFELIRTNPKLRKSSNKKDMNSVIQKIMLDFVKRLEPHTNKKIVLCGKFVQDAFSFYADTKKFINILSVPHPSFNQWKRESNKVVIDKLLEFVEMKVQQWV